MRDRSGPEIANCHPKYPITPRAAPEKQASQVAYADCPNQPLPPIQTSCEESIEAVAKSKRVFPSLSAASPYWSNLCQARYPIIWELRGIRPGKHGAYLSRAQCESLQHPCHAGTQPY